ncbi:glycan-binding surface protein [Flammeovirgaceae bacterium SG7u.111]|nr:glycan-binding surface protein [Flammeovirgaceae bacterium SG7u.132]WPO34168.1 glycan-binding surface protein [Flammeovirgaceae bacterium SG7u.111]
MNNISFKSYTSIALLFLGMLTFQSCSEEDTYPIPMVNNVRPTAEDVTITEGNFGETIAIQGAGLASTEEVWFNSVQAYFNPTMITDNNIVLSIPGDFPEEITDKITVKTKGGSAEFDFKVIVPAPVIKSVSNEYPAVGEVMEIAGSVFYNVQSVVFPGGAEGDILEYTPELIRVVVPDGVTEGALTVNASAGSTESSMKLFDKTGMICDYDAMNKFEDWGKETEVIDGSSNPTSPVPVDGNYIKIQSSTEVPADNWWVDQTVTPHGGIVMPDYPDNDPADMYALKFEYFSVGNFNGGHVQVQFGWGPDYWFEPYTKLGDGNNEDFVSSNWQTAVIPLNQFKSGDGSAISKYGDLKGMDFLLFLLRTPDAPEPLVGFDLNFDNIRVVKIK